MRRGTTQDLLNRLSAYLQEGKFQSTTDEVVARFFHAYMREGFMSGRINAHESSAMIGHFLPIYAQDAFDFVRTTPDPQFVKYREEYESITDGDVPSLVDISGNNVRRHLAVHGFGRILRQIYDADGAWIERGFERYCYAQDEVLKQKVHAFVVGAYRTNLVEMLDKAVSTTFSGTFGKTTLRSISTAGRILMTFARSNPNSAWHMKEDQISIIGEEGDKEGLRFGVQSVYADFPTACALIDDVITHWPQDIASLLKAYQPDRKVALA